MYFRFMTLTKHFDTRPVQEALSLSYLNSNMQGKLYVISYVKLMNCLCIWCISKTTWKQKHQHVSEKTIIAQYWSYFANSPRGAVSRPFCQKTKLASIFKLLFLDHIRHRPGISCYFHTSVNWDFDFPKVHRLRPSQTQMFIASI
jgi:hypothetical protein